MSMQTWAEKEIEIACKREREASDVKDNDWDYVGLTKYIINRLIDGKPLTPIEDTPDIWNNLSRFGDGDDKYTSYQCTRMSSLFKYVYADGTIKYRDIDSFYCVNVNDLEATYHSGLIQRIVDEMFPITMPYCPGDSIKVYCEDFLTDQKNGDFDTVGILYAVKPDDEKININRFFKESEDGWKEIDEVEYNERKTIKIA